MSAITFQPLYMERIWGGRKLETSYHRQLPTPNTPYGEAWEIVDRTDAQSIVSSGALSGKSLHDLWTNHRSEIFGENIPDSERFPLLIKILDSSDDLSIQVHPPAHIAPSLNGEPKTEMWFIADALPGSKLYIGLKKGATRQTFETAIQNGTVADQVHSITPKPGDSIFIESGRLHAIGAGFLIHEIQQNSDTTFRVFDWNRTDSSGNPRQLHIPESLACIDFSDIEPEIDHPTGNTLATCPHFTTAIHHLSPGQSIANPKPDQFSLITITSGTLAGHPKGTTLLIPQSALPITTSTPCSLLQITL